MCEIGSQIYGDESLKENQDIKSVINISRKIDEIQNSSIMSCRSNNEWEQESQRSKVSRMSHRSNIN